MSGRITPQSIGKAKIYKLQRSLSGAKELLCYSKGKNQMFFVPMTKDLKKLFGKEFKIYIYASLKGEQLAFEGLAPEQEW